MKWIWITLGPLLFVCAERKTNGDTDDSLPAGDSVASVLSSLGAERDTAVVYRYEDLSYKLDYKLSYRGVYAVGGGLEGHWTLIVYDKKTNRVLDSLEQNMHAISNNFLDFNRARSYVTEMNAESDVMDSDYGDLIIADFNFDNREDIALANDYGNYSGRFYSFYLQTRNKKFVLDGFLTDSVMYFPTIRTKERRLDTSVLAGNCGMVENEYGIDKKTGTWRQLSRTLIDICGEERAACAEHDDLMGIPRVLTEAIEHTYETQFAMASPREDFQSTDAVMGKALKTRRLIFWSRCRDDFYLAYEHGGLGYHHHAVLLRWQNKKDVLRVVKNVVVWDGKTLAKVKEALEGNEDRALNHF